MPYAIVIVEADHVASARALAEGEFGLSAEVADKEFVPAASPTGNLPATHWWLATKFSDEGFAKLKQLDAVTGWAHAEAYDLDNDPLRPWAVLAELGLQPLKRAMP